jgi:acyl-CoA thioesterase
LSRRHSEWQTAVLRVSALTGEGIASLVGAIAEHEAAQGRGRRLRERMAEGNSPAERCATLQGRDRYAGGLGAQLLAAEAGMAEVALEVGDDHLNFNGTCHGGVVFALADTAFGLASNSYGEVAAGIDAHITYNSAARKGDRLIARAREVSRNRKLAVYRVDVETAQGARVACFTGTVFITARHHTP